MRITKFRIQNYKAITDTEIKLNYSINPIIGVNESGKTSILQAILAFDRNRDKVNSGVHIDYQNKYSTKVTKECKISAFIRLDSKEIKGLLESCEVKTGSLEYEELNAITTETDIILIRELSSETKGYTVANQNLSDRTEKKVQKFLLRLLPFILYFDDFTDRVPDEISFKEEYKTTGKLTFSRNKEWQEIIVEIFRRAEAEGIDDESSPLRYFFNLANQDRKDDILSDIQDVLNKEIIQEWKRIKQSGHQNFADDSANLSIELKCEDQTFTFKVKDKSNQDKKRTFNISERSKGFQWFFNYMIKLKFNPRYKGSQENSIFLLDEPGSYLHSSAQSELLSELKTVSRKNTIVYCTHSQYLLNPKVIKLGSIKVAEKQNAKISLIEYGHYKGKDDKGALSAVYQALQLNFTKDFVGKIVITEGVTDFYFFDLLKIHTNLIKTKFEIIPGAGSGNLSNLISIGLSFSENFVVLFDNDEGAKAIKKYLSEFGDEVQTFFHKYSYNETFCLENFLSSEDQQKLLNLTKTKDLKRAIALMYYEATEEIKKAYFKNLAISTIQSLKNTIARLNEL
jgi:predicted ATP-dependent endonuclease of OLD family